MTTYIPNEWENEVPSTTPLKYRITDDVDGVLADSAKIELLTLVTPGTPLDANRMNHIEQGIVNAQDDASAAVSAATNAVSAAAAAQLAVDTAFGLGCVLSGTINAPKDTLTLASWPAGSNVLDTSGYWNLSSPSRITVPAGLGGWYLIAAWWVQSSIIDAWAKEFVINLNGTPISDRVSDGGLNSRVSILQTIQIKHMVPADYLQLSFAHYTNNATLNCPLNLAVMRLRKD